MVQHVKTQIEQTKNYLRKQTLKTIFDQFDGNIMNLSETVRYAKYEKMKQDPFSFFRGSGYLFYYDMTAVPFSHHTPADKPTWMLGDLHFENFSGFQNQQGEMVFDVDDFDEGYLGSYIYDLLRMVVSIRLFTSQQNFSEKEQDSFIQLYIDRYTEKLKRFEQAEEDPITSRFTSENTTGPIHTVLEKLEKRKRTHRLEKRTWIDEHGRRFFNRDNKKLINLSLSEYEEVEEAWDQYLKSVDEKYFRGKEHYRIKDIVGKTGAGIGSTGLKRFLILMEGEDQNDPDSDVILEAKEARLPVTAYFFPYREVFWDVNAHQGKRVVATQQAMHSRPDPYLGYFTVQNREFYVRERSAYEKDLKPVQFETKEDVEQTLIIMAEISAKIHARADNNMEYGLPGYRSENEILTAINNDQEGFRKELSMWSKFYKERVVQDHQLFTDWLNDQWK